MLESEIILFNENVFKDTNGAYNEDVTHFVQTQNNAIWKIKTDHGLEESNTETRTYRQKSYIQQWFCNNNPTEVQKMLFNIWWENDQIM